MHNRKAKVTFINPSAISLKPNSIPMYLYPSTTFARLILYWTDTISFGIINVGLRRNTQFVPMRSFFRAYWGLRLFPRIPACRHRLISQGSI